METSKIRELLLADGWKEVKASDLKEGDYVAFFDDFMVWHEGTVIPSLDSRNPWWLEENGSIKERDVLLRAPEEWPHLDRRFNADGEEFINISNDPRKPKYVSVSRITSDLLVMDKSAMGGVSYLAHQVADYRNLTKGKPE